MIYKVILEILILPKKPDSRTADMVPITNLSDAVRLIATVPDGLR